MNRQKKEIFDDNLSFKQFTNHLKSFKGEEFFNFRLSLIPKPEK